MAQVIAYQTDVGVSVVYPTGEVSFDTVVQKDVPSGAAYKIIDQSELPSDRDFRGAWVFDNGVKIDLKKAKDLFKQKIRSVREPLLAKLDIDFQRALESNSDTTEIVSKKNALRDATSDPAISSATTVKKLKSIWNEDLLGPNPYTLG